MVTRGDGGHNERVEAGPGTVGEILPALHRRLDCAGLYFGHGTDNAWDEAVQLLLGCLDLPPDSGEEILSQSVSSAERAQINAVLERRLCGEPLAYVLGKAVFAGLEFKSDARALVPRSPLAEVILDDFSPWRHRGSVRRILDLCCGGGCLGIAAAWYQAEASVVLADIDAAALALAGENIALHHLEARVTAQCSDLFAQLNAEPFDIIVCNPPYVDSVDIAAMPAEYRAEPLHALAAGADGLDLAFTILADAPPWLNKGGLLFLELGNSWQALDGLCAELPLTWLEFANGGHGVLLIREDELRQWHEHFAAHAALRRAGGV